MNIPDEAVEAAARALDPHTMGSGGALAEKFKDATRAEARRALEAAAPYMRQAFMLEMNRQAIQDELNAPLQFRKAAQGDD